MNRKTLFCFLTALIMIFVLAGCSGKNSGGNIDNVQIPDWKPSEIYSDSDIEAAFQTVKDYGELIEMFSIFNSVTDYQKKMEIRYDENNLCRI